MLYDDHPQISGILQRDYRDDTIILERFFVRSLPQGKVIGKRQLPKARC